MFELNPHTYVNSEMKTKTYKHYRKALFIQSVPFGSIWLIFNASNMHIYQFIFFGQFVKVFHLPTDQKSNHHQWHFDMLIANDRNKCIYPFCARASIAIAQHSFNDDQTIFSFARPHHSCVFERKLIARCIHQIHEFCMLSIRYQPSMCSFVKIHIPYIFVHLSPNSQININGIYHKFIFVLE